jgi:exodeoxyribonuclease VII large subunit
MLNNIQEDVFSVTEVTRLVKGIIERNLPSFWVEGEVANFTAHSSGHIYFSLKDSNSSLKCVFFRQYNVTAAFRPKNGDKILCQGKVDVYEKTGNYQMLVKQILPSGIGELQLKFLALKKKLEAEGLFSESHKKPLPKYPEKIGIVTSATGAAFQDIKNILMRRFPCQIILYPAVVQGDLASKDIISGLRYFNANNLVDVIIIGRGGGSQEDLFCFNDEKLAREIFASSIPIISAVGHEIDFTIADYVADLRAPTPSAAAELAVPDKSELNKKLSSMQKQLCSLVNSEIRTQRHRLTSFEKSLYQRHPRELLFHCQQRIDEAESVLKSKIDLVLGLKQKLILKQNRLLYAAESLSSRKISKAHLAVQANTNRLINSKNKVVAERADKLNKYKERLQALSPVEAMKRGYAILRYEKKIVKSVLSLNEGQDLEVIMQDGKVQCRVEKTEKKSQNLFS